MSAVMKHRRGSSAEWNFVNSVLEDGELGIEEDTGVIKIGDGESTWAELQPAFHSHYLPILGKANDSDRLDGLDSSAFAKTEDVSGFATTGDLTNQRSALDKLILPDGVDRKLMYNFGAGDAYPANPKPGDQFRINGLLTDMYWTGTAWRQVDSPSLTAAQRKGLDTAASTTLLYPGFTVYESDTKRRWMFDGTGWQYLGGGVQPRVKLRGSNVSPPVSADGAWLNWTTPEYDTDSFWNSSTSEVKIPVGLGGIYEVQISWNVGATTAFTTAFFYRVIGGTKAGQTSPPTKAVLNAGGVTAASPIAGSGPIRCAENDVFSFQYYSAQAGHSAGGNSFGAPSFVAFTWIGQR